ncbi:hypothetical protein [Actinoplanes sp. NBRC 101535]|uniref:hypothetical protein n=1 Tax=Actinoplanes sp. NBRC 101535 TaxID=3032196 RepID=UPI0025576918|nr:hypothetical protein [Actinoplanes sp. NBRC 101535]
MIFGHPLRRCIGEVEPDLGCVLDRGGLGDPAGDEGRVAAGVEGGAVAVDLGVGVGDGLADLGDAVWVAGLGEC